MGALPPTPPKYFSRERKTKNPAERTKEGDTPTNEAAKKFHFSRGQHEAASMGKGAQPFQEQTRTTPRENRNFLGCLWRKVELFETNKYREPPDGARLSRGRDQKGKDGG